MIKYDDDDDLIDDVDDDDDIMDDMGGPDVDDDQEEEEQEDSEAVAVRNLSRLKMQQEEMRFQHMIRACQVWIEVSLNLSILGFLNLKHLNLLLF